MKSKSIVRAFITFCITAALFAALCGCDDLGAYEDTEEYYSSFGNIVLIDGTSGEDADYSVSSYFYNKDSREDFLKGEDGAYKGITPGDYVYMAIPFKSNINMDTLALYLQAQDDVSVYINAFVSDKIPSDWKSIADNVKDSENSDGKSAEKADEQTQAPEEKYDDPDPKTRIGTVTVHLKKEKWNSFVLDTFKVNGQTQKTIQIKDGQYVLLQIRNNSGVRVFDEEKQVYVDPETGLELPKASITMTNLLIRALEVKVGDQAQGGN